MITFNDLKFTTEAKWTTPMNSIPVCEVVFDNGWGILVQLFPNSEYLCMLMKSNGKTYLPLLDNTLYPEYIDPLHKKNNYGGQLVVEKCLEKFQSLETSVMNDIIVYDLLYADLSEFQKHDAISEMIVLRNDLNYSFEILMDKINTGVFKPDEFFRIWLFNNKTVVLTTKDNK